MECSSLPSGRPRSRLVATLPWLGIVLLLGCQQGPAAIRGGELPSARVLELGSRSRLLPRDWTTPAALAALRQHVVAGGGLFLRGRALRLLPMLGLMQSAPVSSTQSHGLTESSRGDGLAIGLGFTPSGIRALAVGAAPRWLVAGSLVRAELDPMRVSAILADGQVFAEQFTRLDGELTRRSDALLCGWQVGAGRVLALGLGSSEPVPEDLDDRFRTWLAHGDTNASHAVLLDAAPNPSVDGWGPRAEQTAEPSGPVVLRVDARWLDATRGDRVLDEIRAAGVETLVVEDDGANLESWLRRAERLERASLRFGLAATQVRSELEPLLDWQYLEGGVSRAPALAVFVELPRRVGRGATAHPGSQSALDPRIVQKIRRNCSTALWTALPLPKGGSGACAYLPAEAGGSGDVPAPGAPAGRMSLLPPSIYRVLELDARRASGAWADALWARAAAFSVGRKGATILLRADTAPGGFEHSLEVARLLADPLASASSFRVESGGASGFAAAYDALRADASTRRRAEAGEVRLTTSKSCLRNRWFDLNGNALRVDPEGLGRFAERAEESAVTHRVTDSWSRVVIHGMRIGDPRLFERLLDPAVKRLEGGTISPSRSLQRLLRLDAGRYVASLTVVGSAEDAIGVFRGPGGRRAFFGLRAGATRRLHIELESGTTPEAVLEFALLRGTSLQIQDLEVREEGVESEVATTRPHAGLRATRTSYARAGHFAVERTTITRGDMPALVQALRFRDSAVGIRFERRARFPGYRIHKDGSAFILKAEGKPTLAIHLLRAGRMRPSIEGDTWVLRGHPRAFEDCVFAVVLPHAIPAKIEAQRLRRGLLALAESAPVEPDSVAASPGGAAASPGGAVPRDDPALAPGAAMSVRILERRPGLVRLRVFGDRGPAATTALRFETTAPHCYVDRQVWSHVEDRTVWLPRKAGDYIVEWDDAPLRGPRVLATRAAISKAFFDEKRRELRVTLAAPFGRSKSGTEGYVVRIAGPAPAEISGAALVSVDAPYSFVVEAPSGSFVLRWD